MAKSQHDNPGSSKGASPSRSGSSLGTGRRRRRPGAGVATRVAHPSLIARFKHKTKSPIFRFVVTLAVLMVVANVILYTDLFRDNLMPKYLRGWAGVSAAALSVLGEDARVVDSSVSSSRFSVNIKQGCDAIQPTVLFVTAVLASPVALMSKIPGLLIGVFFLMFMNLVRVLSLFYIGIYWYAAFDTMHHDVWQALFIILSIAAWALWALWAVRKTTLPASDTALALDAAT